MTWKLRRPKHHFLASLLAVMAALGCGDAPVSKLTAPEPERTATQASAGSVVTFARATTTTDCSPTCVAKPAENTIVDQVVGAGKAQLALVGSPSRRPVFANMDLARFNARGAKTGTRYSLANGKLVGEGRRDGHSWRVDFEQSEHSSAAFDGIAVFRDGVLAYEIESVWDTTGGVRYEQKRESRIYVDGRLFSSTQITSRQLQILPGEPSDVQRFAGTPALECTEWEGDVCVWYQSYDAYQAVQNAYSYAIDGVSYLRSVITAYQTDFSGDVQAYSQFLESVGIFLQVPIWGTFGNMLYSFYGTPAGGSTMEYLSERMSGALSSLSNWISGNVYRLGIGEQPMMQLMEVIP